MNIEHRPFWVTLAAVLLALSLLTVPVMISRVPEVLKMYVVFYIPYAPLAAWLSWRVYPRRTELFWIIQLLAWVSLGLLLYSCF